MPRRGRVGTSMTTFRVSRSQCKHVWSPWKKAGILDATERRECSKCKRIQTRKTKPVKKKGRKSTVALSKRTSLAERTAPVGNVPSKNVKRPSSQTTKRTGAAKSRSPRKRISTAKATAKIRAQTRKKNEERLRSGIDSHGSMVQRELGTAATDAEWDATGFTASERQEWGKLAFDPHSAQHWKGSGFTASAAIAWSRVNIRPDEARKLRASGLLPSEIAAWRSAGFGVAEMAAWNQTGISPVDAKKWKAAGETPTSAAERRDEGHKPPTRPRTKPLGQEDWRFFK